MSLLTEVRALMAGPIGKTVRQRMLEFEQIRDKTSAEWFCEMCFCLGAANSTAKLNLKLQHELGFEGFMHNNLDELYSHYKQAGHRFWNQRAERIVEARKYWDIRNILIQEMAHSMGLFDVHTISLDTIPLHAAEASRQWLVTHINGFGLKEASHFLRNVGLPYFAINDRHIVHMLVKHKHIKQPTSMTPKEYYALEDVQRKLAAKLGIQVGEWDLYLWYMKAGEVLK